jgi:hypothetical protein
MIRNKDKFVKITGIGSAVLLLIWLVALIIWADMIAIYFWLSLSFFILFILSIGEVIKIPDTKEYQLEQKKHLLEQKIHLEKLWNEYEKDEKMARSIDHHQKQHFVDKYGYLSKEIIIDQYCNSRCDSELVENKILIFENSSIIIIRSKIFSFTDIIAFDLKDDERIIYQSSFSTSKSSSSTGNMIGRAVIGGILLGGVGAIVGGATAKTKTTTINTPQQTSVTHNYTVHIIVNSISEPQIVLNLGKNEESTNELVAVLSVILERNKKID